MQIAMYIIQNLSYVIIISLKNNQISKRRVYLYPYSMYLYQSTLYKSLDLIVQLSTGYPEENATMIALLFE